MNIDNFIIALEGYMIPDNDMDIVTEAFNIKEHLKRFWDAVKKFFKRIYDWIQDRIFKVLNKGEILVNKKLYTEFKEMIQKDSATFGENIKYAIADISNLAKKKRKEMNDSQSSKDLSNISNYLVKQLSELFNGYTNDLSYKSDTPNISSKDVRSNYTVITPAEVTSIKNEIKKFEDHANQLNKHIQSKMTFDTTWSFVDIQPYHRMVTSGLNATHKYMQFLDRILIYPKEPKKKKNKYEVIELGGSFKVTPIVD